ncbi:MAG TPA: GDP-mannose 4,6-dehydratase, partial [Ktedonobacterales bacterium]|nr:GDP-mannose 4,6-dehydratase [Ktedonobacterales bacterium]
RDWGFAGDYVEAMWLMLQQKRPQDYVIATGETHSVREFAQAAFAAAGISDWEHYVEINPQYLRPAEVDHLIGDASRARRELGWAPRVSFVELVRMMVESDLAAVRREQQILATDHAADAQRQAAPSLSDRGTPV